MGGCNAGAGWVASGAMRHGTAGGVMRLLALALAAAALVTACGDAPERVVLHRSNCLVCHQPLDERGEAHGIEEAHPWAELSCVDCHGGQDRLCDGELVVTGGEPECRGEWMYDQRLAHVSPGDGPVDLRGLSPAELDRVDRDYLRFVNPGDHRVVQDTCGRCHTNVAAAARRSLMTHGAGELAAARFRAGQDSSPVGRFAAVPVQDPAPLGAQGCGAVAAFARFSPPPIVPGSADPVQAPTAGNAVDQLLAKTCIGCHLSSFGAGEAPGTHRSSGCTGCHMPYAEDGLSRSSDPWVDKQAAGHPVRHSISTAPPTEACVACHHDGAQIGLSFQGMRAPADAAHESPFTGRLERALYGWPAGALVVDEDTRNDWDETPPDLHFEAGMSCIDCHTQAELHGDGHLQSRAACVVRTTCEDCHGTVAERARTSALRPGLRVESERVVLTTRVDGRELVVPQLAEAAVAAHAGHVGEVGCVTCHAGWMPSCYGCHVTVDLSEGQAYLTTGAQVPGAIRAERGPVRTHDMVLMRDQNGFIMPSLPAERLVVTLSEWLDAPGGAAEHRYVARSPRAFPAGGGAVRPGFGQRPIDPHTTRRVSAFMACDRCHSEGDAEAPDNEALLDLTHGFGTERFVVETCDVAAAPGCEAGAPTKAHRLDAVQTRTGEALVVPATLGPEAARPLTFEEIGRMRAIGVPADAWPRTEPPQSSGDTRWPRPVRVE